MAVLDRIEAETPATPETTALREAILAGADADAINSLLLAELGATRLRSEYTQARNIAGQRILAAIHAERDDLHAGLADLADDAISQLAAVAALDGASLEHLVSVGRHDDAQALVNARVVGAELHALYEIRDLYLTPGGPAEFRAGHFDCSQYRDPRVATRHHSSDLDVTDNYVHALRQGAELWYPTSEEALAAAAPLYAEWERNAARIAAKQRQVGGITAF
ncbi:hypothetical protein A5722_25525 [Mycobacterium vulneris]|nr:hypothetical protein A5722_25525 [Mycolicibacterium vulneris]OCB63972.1 hypothetical protein A5729_22855 [Mycolicibacterium vulneris]